MDGAERTRDPPGRDDLDVRLKAIKGELEPDLIIALAGAAMRDKAASIMSDGFEGKGSSRRTRSLPDQRWQSCHGQ